MTKKKKDVLTPIHDDDTDTKIYEKNVETVIYPSAPESAKTRILGDPPAKQKQASNELPPGSSRSIGDYRIIRKIGEGGMGIVYEAEQQHPQRLVALKVIRRGLQTDEYHIKLFEREIQALARLKHPGIAAIYESGLSADGQIFFAMELVRGTSLLNFVQNCKSTADDSRFDIKRQFELFGKICEVVSYAHQRGVIHRDLKPDNILVTDEFEEYRGSDSMFNKVGVKILDFGLARITEPEFAGTDQPLSKVGQIKGTLQYMSPEQVRGKPDEIDVRSDVYALGGILYEMLTDQLPYDISQASILEAVRIICEVQPKMPDKVWSVTRGEGRRKSGKIDQDVETIVLKALEKDPARRYQSVMAMADDITRYLTNQPILARPPSALYQFRKLVARHKAVFASLAAIFLMLLGFGIVMAAQSTRIASERDKAVKAEQLAEDKKNDAEQSRQSEQKQRLIAEDNLKRAEQQQAIAEEEKALAEKAQKSEQEQRLIAENNFKQARTEQKRAEEQKALAQKQQTIAQQQKTLAERRQAETEVQRLKAEEQKKIAEQQSEANRRLWYVSQVNLADQAWEQADVSRMQELLENQIPKSGQADLRGFEWYYLWRLSHLDLITFRPSGRIFSTGFSPDGKMLVVSSFENTSLSKKNPKITLLDAATGQMIDTIEGRLFLAFSPDGKLLTTTEKDEIGLVDLKTKEISPSKIKISSSLLTTLSPDGKLIASIGSEGKVELFDTSRGNKIFSLKGIENFNSFGLLFSMFSRPMRFSPDDKTLAFVFNNQVIFWDLTTGQEIPGLKSEKMDLFSIAFSPDGKTLASEGFDGTVNLWDLTTKQALAVLKDQEKQISFGGALPSMDFSPDGKILATTSGSEVKIWDIATKHEITTIKGHGEPVLSLLFSPDSQKLATVSPNESVKVWGIPIEGSPTTLKGQVSGALSPDGKILATIGVDGRFRLWDFASKREIVSFGDTEIEPKTFAVFPQFSSDGKILAVVRYSLLTKELAKDVFSFLSSMRFSGGSLELWDVASRKKLPTLEENIVDFVFSPVGNRLVTVVNGRTPSIHLWDVNRQKVLFSFEKGNVAAFSPDGKILAIGVGDTVKLIDVETGQELPATFNVTQSVSAIAFSIDGKILATSAGKNIVLWDFNNQTEIGTLKGPSSYVSHLTFSSDNKRIATVSLDGIVKIWDVATNQTLVTIKAGNSLPVNFSPDCKTLITGGNNGVQIWRAATEEEVLRRIKR